MPNHIDNILDVTGNSKKVQDFCDLVYKAKDTCDPDLKVQSGDEYLFDFEATVPMPKELGETQSPNRDRNAKDLKKKYGAEDWYEWATRVGWGTKWGAYDAQQVESIKDGLRFRFNTAWCIGYLWLEKTSKLYPTLTFTTHWQDEGGGSGKTVFRNGQCMMNRKMNDHDFNMAFNERYRETYEEITTLPYDEFIQEYVTNNKELEWYSLDLEIIKRVKDKDLPLTFSLELYGEAKELRDNRLKGLKNVPARKISW